MASLPSAPGGDLPESSEEVALGDRLLCGTSLSTISLRPQVSWKGRPEVRSGLSARHGHSLQNLLMGADDIYALRDEGGLGWTWVQKSTLNGLEYTDREDALGSCAKKPTLKGQEDNGERDEGGLGWTWVQKSTLNGLEDTDREDALGSCAKKPTLKGQEDNGESLDDDICWELLDISLETEYLGEYEDESFDEDLVIHEECTPYIKFLGRKGRKCRRAYKNGKPKRFERQIKRLPQGMDG